jgi:mono/diheme cytochrome c family protein
MRFLVVLIMASLLVAAVFAADNYATRQLLRADPDALPADAMLLGFAVRRGEPLFAARCAACHGASGSGDAVRGIPDLTDNDWLYGTGRTSEIEKVIDYGIRSRNPKAWNLAVMPAYARPQPNPADKNIQPLTPGEIDDVIEFLMRQQGRLLRLPFDRCEGRLGDWRAESQRCNYALWKRQPRCAAYVHRLWPPRRMPRMDQSRKRCEHP